MRRPRRNHTAAFKAKVSITALKRDANRRCCVAPAATPRHSRALMTRHWPLGNHRARRFIVARRMIALQSTSKRIPELNATIPASARFTRKGKPASAAEKTGKGTEITQTALNLRPFMSRFHLISINVRRRVRSLIFNTQPHGKGEAQLRQCQPGRSRKQFSRKQSLERSISLPCPQSPHDWNGPVRPLSMRLTWMDQAANDPGT
jgi:hypothetical protein